MKILVVGTGALGTLFGVKLKIAGNDVHFFAKNSSIASFLTKNGFTLIDKNSQTKVFCPVFAPDNLPSFGFDIILFLVKAYDTQQALSNIKVVKTDCILTLQNGLGHQEILKSHFGVEKTLVGITGEGALYLSPGLVSHTGKGDTLISFFTNRRKAQNIVEVFRKAGFSTEIEENMEGILWGKLIINSAINPLSALTGKTNGELLYSKGIMRIMREVVKEGMLVANSLGIKLPFSNLQERLNLILSKTSSNKSSMLQDIEREKKTEIEYINGYLIKKAEERMIDVPVNRALYLLIKSIEKEFLK